MAGKRDMPFSNHYSPDRGQPSFKKFKSSSKGQKNHPHPPSTYGSPGAHAHGTPTPASAKTGPPFIYGIMSPSSKYPISREVAIHNQIYLNSENKLSAQADKLLSTLSRLPDPDACEPCFLAAGEWQRGFISLLDKLVEEETGPKGDADIRHHARELQKLLSARDVHPLQARLDLDAKRPLPQPEAHIPVYIAHRITAASTLPPLPPILEPALADAVFTHSAYTNVQKQKGLPVGDNYERLEFLGDAYIEIVASRILHSRFPHIEASQQAHFRENLVKNETLFKFACAYSFPDRLRHGSHLEKNKAWEKIISDTFEAYVAGVVLSDPEHGFEIVEDWLTNLWAPQLLNYQEKMIDNPAARTNLQALICAKGIKLDYREEKPMEMRDGGQQHFFVGVYLTGWGFENAWLGSGEDRAKGDAAINAANDALRRSEELGIIPVARKKKLEMYPNAKPVEKFMKSGKHTEKQQAEATASANGTTTPTKEDTDPAAPIVVEAELKLEGNVEHCEDPSTERKERKKKAKNKEGQESASPMIEEHAGEASATDKKKKKRKRDRGEDEARD